MQVRSLGYRTDLMMLALQGSTITDRGDHLVLRTAHNTTYWWGNYLLYADPPAPGDVERWLAAFDRELPGAAHRAFGIDGTNGQVGAVGELTGAGFTVNVERVLTTTQLHDPSRIDPEATIRRLDPADKHDWSASIALQGAGNADLDPQSYLVFLTDKMRAYRRLQESGHGAWFGAFVDGEMRAGLGIFTDGSGLARYRSVDTHPDFRRRGLASLLVAAGRYALSELGAHTLVIVAEPGYHAIDIYRRLGFADAQDQVQAERRPSR